MTLVDGHWLAVRDGDLRARALFIRHYSAGKHTHARYPIGNQARFAGPGAGPGGAVVLLTEDCRALFVWRAERFRRDGQEGINCAVFRNESGVLSSELIREADALAWQRWPGERHFTFVDEREVRHKRDPGRCFLRAGWRRCGRSKERGLLILERLPS